MTTIRQRRRDELELLRSIERDAARGEGRPALTLTTFSDVPWNAPYYQRLGFAIVEPSHQGFELAAAVARETRSIPGRAPRVAMRRPLT